MIIDSHHHLWNYQQEEYGWMDDSMEILKRNYGPGDLEPELKSTGVTATVVVQARQSLEETKFLLDLADEHSFIRGVVGWMDLCSPLLEEQLESYATHPKLVGVRHVIHDEPDDDFMLGEEFIQGISKLQTYGLSYDLLLFPKHLERAAELLKMFPDQRFVLDHLGKPPIRSGELKSWKKDLEKLAVLPNLWCKLSGMVTEANPLSWERDDFLPYMDVVLDSFGADRVMLGSDWPVCMLGGTYREVMEIPLEFISKLDASEKENIQYQSAIDCYQLQTEN
jgi:L-fuconolactonase